MEFAIRMCLSQIELMLLPSPYHCIFVFRHPDKNPTKEAEEKYKDITNAYEVLSDPTKRNEYELSIRPGHWNYAGRQQYKTDTVELTYSYVF